MRRLKRSWALALAALTVAALAPVAFAGFYYQPAPPQCVYPGQAAVSGYNGWTVNSVKMVWTCAEGTNPQMGLTYMYSSGAQYAYVWSACNCLYGGNTFTDSRNISYGRAICKANDYNSAGVAVEFCFAGTGSG